MSCMEPYAIIVGTARFYLAPARTPPPTGAGEPASPWIYLGQTDGEQTIEYTGEVVLHRVNERTGPVKANRPEEDIVIGCTLVDATLETVARVLHAAHRVTTSGTPERKRMPFKRGACPPEYALLMWGASDSPYGLYPAYNYWPRVVSSAEPTLTRTKDEKLGIEAMWTALEDATQATGEELGWAVAFVSA